MIDERMKFQTITLRLICCLLLLSAVGAHGDALFKEETGVDRVHNLLNRFGSNVIVAVLDRGIDYTHPDFITENGDTRILAILDLTDSSGADDPQNPYDVGTLVDEQAINDALTTGTPLSTRDAVGHGTATAGVAAGNGAGSDGLFGGMAPHASIVVVKFTTEGAPAHNDQPAESPFYDDTLLEPAIRFVKDIAEDQEMPVVILANFGSIQGPMDGTSQLARLIDSEFGPGHPGVVFVSGSSDNGGVDNHAAGTLIQDQTTSISFNKATPALRLSLWYGDSNTVGVSLTTPTTTVDLPTPQTNNIREQINNPEFTFYHNGSAVDFFGAENDRNEILLDINGPDGTYILNLQGVEVTDGSFQASLSPSSLLSEAEAQNRFLSHVVTGHTIWDLASANFNITPNSYVLRPEWTDINGITRTAVGNEGGEGSLWAGSGVGPTYDGRIGITVSAPGNQVIAPYGQTSYWSTFDGNRVSEGNGLYGTFGAVSGAAPVVTGTIALMLEVDPELNAAQVAHVLKTTARADQFTGQLPNPSWGHGKLSAFDAVAMLTYSESFANNVLLFPKVRVGDQYYRVELTISNPETYEFELLSAEPTDNPGSEHTAEFLDGKLYFKFLKAGESRYSGALSLISENPVRFQLFSAFEH